MLDGCTAAAVCCTMSGDYKQWSYMKPGTSSTWRSFSTDAKRDPVVMVTGGNGFLGQHIVKLLHEKSNAKEIVVLDTSPFKKALDYKERASIHVISGDLRSEQLTKDACSGSDVIIHTAGLIEFGPLADYSKLQSINVKGTENVIQACVTNNVGCLIQTSSSFVRVGKTPVLAGDESLPQPKEFLLPNYSKTKSLAEQAVLNVNGITTSSGKQNLRTVALRPGGMYGEGDSRYIGSSLERASRNNGISQRVGNGLNRVSDSYVGNVAWAHIVAMERMMTSPDDTIFGKAYFVGDHPALNPFDLIDVFLQRCGFHAKPQIVPFKPLYYILAVLEQFVKAAHPVIKFELPTNTSGLQYICSDYVFSDALFRKKFGYEPLYSFKECIERSAKYYDTLYYPGKLHV